MNPSDRYRRPWGPGYRPGPEASQPRWEERPHESDLFSESNDPQYFGTGRYGGPDYGAQSSERIDAYRHYPRAGGYGEPSLYGTPGGAGGPAGTAPRHLRRGPKGYTRSDERIKEDIHERLWHTPFLDASDVTVEVQGGKVTLTGTVPDRSMKHAIEDLTDACVGVQEIDNRIRVQR